MQLGLRWLLVIALAIGAPVAAWGGDAPKAEDAPKADDPPKEGDAPNEDDAQPDSADDDVAGVDDVPLLREAENAEAKPLVAGLKKAFKAKNSNDVKKALEAIQELKHKDFIKPLIKLMGHENSRAAAWAGEYLEHRASKDDIKTLWKKVWNLKVNKRRFSVRTKVLRIYARLEHDLDKKQFDDVRRQWAWMIGNPHPSFGPALADICVYFGQRKDKRMALQFAWELTQPGTDTPGSPANPPQEWWERRVKMWQGMHAAATEALKQMTGEEFDSREKAKAWFQANEKEFGVKWSDW